MHDLKNVWETTQTAEFNLGVSCSKLNSFEQLTVSYQLWGSIAGQILCIIFINDPSNGSE